MRKTISFHAPIVQSTALRSRPELFEKSIESFENKQYQTALDDLLESIHPDIRKEQHDRQTTVYHVPHGPLNIRITIDGEELSVEAPFVTMPEKETIPMLRQVAILNFKNLDLSRLIRKDNGLYFTYSSPLQYCHPRKIRKVLEEICRTGQKYDYDFSDQFDIERITEPCFTPYDTEKVEYVYQTLQSSCRECIETLKYFETLHQYNDMWLIVRTTFLKLLYVAQPQGKLQHKLTKAVSNLDRDLSLSELVTDAKATVEQLMEMPQEEIANDLYYTETFISDKNRSILQNLREDYENCYKQVTALMESGDHRKVCLKIIHKLYETYHLYRMDDDLNRLFAGVLKQASVQPWAIAAPVLYQFLDNIMQGRIKRDFPPVAA